MVSLLPLIFIKFETICLMWWWHPSMCLYQFTTLIWLAIFQFESLRLIFVWKLLFLVQQVFFCIVLCSQNCVEACFIKRYASAVRYFGWFVEIRHLICGNNYSWMLNLNLIYEKLDWDRKWLVDFNAGKTQLVLFD